MFGFWFILISVLKNFQEAELRAQIEDDLKTAREVIEALKEENLCEKDVKRVCELLCVKIPCGKGISEFINK